VEKERQIEASDAKARPPKIYGENETSKTLREIGLQDRYYDDDKEPINNRMFFLLVRKRVYRTTSK
jgi:hypothetical protein